MTEDFSPLYTPWSNKKGEMKNIAGDEQLLKDAWDEAEGLAFYYIWLLVR